MATLRPYRPTDVEDVLSTWEKASSLAHPFLSDAFQAEERKMIRDVYLPHSETWVVEVDGRVVGFIGLIGNEIGGLFLQPAYHGRKLGKLMVDKARELHGDLEVEVFEKNTVGRRFYKRYGFRLMETKLEPTTGERMLRLTYSADPDAGSKESAAG